MSTESSTIAAAFAASVAPAAQPQSNSGTFKLPPFWINRPVLWFAQAESIFRGRNPSITTDIDKYDCVLHVLPHEALEKCEHVIVGEDPVGGRYPALKNALIESYGRTTARKQAELIELATTGALGDRRPTDYLMQIRNLSGSEYELSLIHI